MGRLLLLLCAVFLNAPALAEGAQTRGNATVVIAPDGDDLLVTITLDRAVDRLRLEQADVVRDDAVKLETPGLTFADNAISAEAPFTEVRLRLVQDLTERDAKYPPFYRIAQGRLLYAPTVYPEEEAWEVKLTLANMPDGWARWPETPLPMGYLFIGPQSMVIADNAANFAFDGAGNAAFENELRHSVGKALAFLTDAFGSPPQSKPFVVTSLLASERSFSTGDVTENAMVALRFFGNAPDPAAPDALATTRSIILHEGVHFWNGGVAHFTSDAPQWLHEGGAEYIATLGSLRLGWSSREDMQARIGQWFDRCQTSLAYSDEAALNDIPFLNASLRYSCGPLLHAIMEVYLAESGSDSTVITGWRETVRKAAAENTEYGLADFYAALGDPAMGERPALAALLATSGTQRWAVIESELTRMGVTIERVTDAPLRARTALMHLIRPQCTDLKPGEGYGFYSGATSYRLDTSAGCGILAGNPEVNTLAGRSVTDLGEADYAALQAICAARGTVAFGLTDGSAIDVPCATDLAPAATRSVVTALPDIPAFQ